MSYSYKVTNNWPAHPDDPQGIRVASVIEFSVFSLFSICSLFSVCYKQIFLLLLQYDIRPSRGLAIKNSIR